jgi:uncharacterized protein YbaP (TraB family)
MSDLMRRPLAVLALLLALLAPALAWAKPPVWVAHGQGATVTLFGSVHILPRDVDWEPEALERALAEADELWFETPIDPKSILDASRQALADGMLPQSQSLPELLSAEGKARLRRQEDALHLPGFQLERLKPWLAELTIGDAAYARDGATPDQGVERRLADAAPQAARRAFETPAQQVAMFSGMPEAVQVASLEGTLRDLEEDPNQARRLIDAWLRSDLAALNKEGVEELRRESPAMFKVLLTDRNAAWLRTLVARLNAPPANGPPARIVVVVGVGHLTGSGGLPELLRRQGIRVDGPTE